MPVPRPANEPSRLDELLELGILDTLAEQQFDDIVALASRLCGMPIAIINFVDHDRQWGKALIGLESSEAPREASFCARTLLADDGVLIVEDTHLDPLFADNPQVTGAPHLRFYAGVSIVSARGHALGSVCVADRQPRTISADEVAGLQVLARQTAALLELRLVTGRLAAANEALANLAARDELTGLPNRRLIRELLDRQLRAAERTGAGLGVVFADVDGLKAVNDRQGHVAGDLLLRMVADRLLGVARASDTVGRISGDEFVLVCPDVTRPTDLERVAQRLRDAVAIPTRLGSEISTPTVGVGTALAEPGDDVDRLLARADRAMYADKHLGR